MQPRRRRPTRVQMRSPAAIVRWARSPSARSSSSRAGTCKPTAAAPRCSPACRSWAKSTSALAASSNTCCRPYRKRSTRPAASVELFGRNLRQISQPSIGIAVRWRAPVAARRERAARADLGRVRHGAPLVLAHLEEAPQEDREPFADLHQRVLIAPGVPREVGDFGRRIAEAQRVVQVEVLQLVGAYRALGLLLAGDQLRTDVGFEHAA